MGQLLVIVSVVLTLLTAVLGFANRSKLAGAVEAQASAEAKVTQQQSEVTKAQADLKKATDDLTAANTEKEQMSSQLTAAQADLEKVKTDSASAASDVTTKTAEIARIQGELDEANRKIAEIENSGLPKTTTADPELQTVVAEKEAVITKLQSDLDSSRTKLETLEKADQARRTGQLQQGLEGRVLAVNQAWNFVVLNLGDRNGVANNAEMLIKRGNQLIGKVRITSVEPSTSIGDIIANSVPSGVSVQPGDNVIVESVE